MRNEYVVVGAGRASRSKGLHDGTASGKAAKTLPIATWSGVADVDECTWYGEGCRPLTGFLF